MHPGSTRIASRYTCDWCQPISKEYGHNLVRMRAVSAEHIRDRLGPSRLDAAVSVEVAQVLYLHEDDGFVAELHSVVSASYM